MKKTTKKTTTYNVVAVLSDARSISGRFETVTRAFERALEWSRSSWHTSNGARQILAVYIAGDAWAQAEVFTIPEIRRELANGNPQQHDEETRDPLCGLDMFYGG